jgi:hypothetical protein
MARSTSLTEKDASLAQYHRSQAVIMSMPPPKHAPCYGLLLKSLFLLLFKEGLQIEQG